MLDEGARGKVGSSVAPAVCRGSNKDGSDSVAGGWYVMAARRKLKKDTKLCSARQVQRAASHLFRFAAECQSTGSLTSLRNNILRSFLIDLSRRRIT